MTENKLLDQAFLETLFPLSVKVKDVVVATESVTDLKKKKQSCDVVVVEKEDIENAFFSLPSSYGYRP